ncbi:MAG: 5-oxoprolinase subunit PxpA [Lachnospiraceae bacterium]|nr:5-oxoprolinase subunit PxpA [Lachnospiraceae bacterium]
MFKIDLNCDLGESFGAYTIGSDKAVIPHISSANVACGYHASDPVVMEETVAMAAKYGVAVGAHPGFPDLMGFGRRQLMITPAEAKAYVMYQIGALSAFCTAAGIRLQHVKPHGALYNMAGKDYALAKAICEGIKAVDETLIMSVLSGSQMQRAAADTGLKYAREVFADRGYQADGSLVPRGQAGAMITEEEEAISRVIRMIKEHKVTAVDGTDVAIVPDTVCVHGDGEKAVLFVKKLGEAFKKEGIEIAPLRDIII